MTERVSGADRCLCKDKCWGISMYLCRGLPSALAASTLPQRPWQGLTDEEISASSKGHMTRNGFARVVEAKLRVKNT